MSSGGTPGTCGGSSSEDEMIAFGTAQRRKRVEDDVSNTKRGPKVDRSTDQRTPWTRTRWDGHADAKIRAHEWNDYYHMPVVTFYRLHALLFAESAVQKARSTQQGGNSSKMGPIDTRVKLACALRELFGEKRKSLADVFLLSKTAVRIAFLDVVRRINACPELHGEVFQTVQTPELLHARACAFQQRSAHPNVFRHVVGAIDGLFIKTQQPRAKEVVNVRSYFSGHKRGFGINMQGVCDATCRFIGFACNTSGSTSDYVAFKEANISGIWPQLQEPYFYVGDCAYPLAPFCLIPYVGKLLPNDEDVFNFFHSQLRITIERAFGIFVNVFRIFHSPLTFSIRHSCEVVEACVKIHNYRIDQGCQVVLRTRSSGAIFRTAFERSGEMFDVLDDERYVTSRPHDTDRAYARHVAAAEATGTRPNDARAGALRRTAIAAALSRAGAQRPTASVQQQEHQQ